MRLSKQSWGWWFETPPWSLWRQCNAVLTRDILMFVQKHWYFWRWHFKCLSPLYVFCEENQTATGGFPHKWLVMWSCAVFLWWHLEQTTEQKKELSCRSLETSRRMIASSNWSIFRVTGALGGESTGHRWFPLTKANNAALWCFLWFAPEQTAEQPIETPVIWDAIALIMTSL